MSNIPSQPERRKTPSKPISDTGISAARLVIAELLETQAKLKEEVAELKHRSTHDPLTQLPNRKLFEQTFKKAQELEETGGAGAIMFIDFDDFGEINKGKGGNTAGDHLLQGVSGALKDIVTHAREDDMIARLGGDEFVVLMAGASEEIATERAKLICRLFSKIVAVDDIEVSTGISIGVASFDSLSPYEQVLTNADQAMRAAKELGKGNAVHYSALQSK
jgi:diguanylate cyclase (GGDEF)-like protein